MAPLHVQRVNQLDARKLDDEIHTMLRQQLAGVTLHSAGFWDRFSPELDALMRGVLWRYSIWIDAPTPGGELQNVVYSRASHQGFLKSPLGRGRKLAFLLVHVVFPWFLLRFTELVKRLQYNAESVSEGDGLLFALSRWPVATAAARWYLQRLEPVASRLYAVFSAINFFLFLRNGVFSTLGDRLLGVRMVHIDPSAHRHLPMEYMNRMMVWNGFSEFLMTVVPLLPLGRWRHWVARRLPKRVLRSMDGGGAGTCGFCDAAPMALPVLADCGHRFCYFCLASEEMSDPGNVPCPRCGEHIKSFGYAT